MLELKLNHWLIFQSTVLGFTMLASSMTGFNGVPMAPSVGSNIVEIKISTSSVAQEIVVSKEKNITAEEYVRNYFSDIPVLIEIARCESRFRQYDTTTGNVLRGEQNNLDRGVMQINEYYHNGNSDKLGYDILTLEGNTAYARHLFEKYGVKPWSSSAKCWSKSTAYSEYKTELAMN